MPVPIQEMRKLNSAYEKKEGAVVYVVILFRY